MILTPNRLLRTLTVLMALPCTAAAANYYYDNAGRLLKVDYGTAGAVVYGYDASGDLISRQILPPAASPKAPTISSVSNAEGGVATIAPNTWVAIYGSNLAPAGDSRTWKAPGDFANNQLPTQLDNVSVTVNGKSAFVYYISPTQVNILTPPDPMQGTVLVQLTSSGIASAPFAVQAQTSAPSLFVFNGGPYAVAVHANGSLIGPLNLYPGVFTPATPGENIVLFANGFGPVSAPLSSGALGQSGQPLLPLSIRIGGVAVTVKFAGLISPGLFQFNVVVPSGALNGDNAVAVSYAGLNTQPGTLISVAR